MARIEQRLEKAMQKMERRRVAVSRRLEVFQDFSKYHVEWLAELLTWYKRKGMMPNFPVFRLPMYYGDKKDKEVAAFAAALLNDGANFDELHELIGQNPWEWLTGRYFVLLGHGDKQNDLTSGCKNWRLSSWMNRILQAVNENDADDIESAVNGDAWRWGLSTEETLVRYASESDIGNEQNTARMLLLSLSGHEIVGNNVWEMREPLRCPLLDCISDFVRMWCPDPWNFGSLDNCTELFSTDAGDFMLSYYAYSELSRVDPLGCRRYATIYLKWYLSSARKKRCQWKMIQPEIPKD